MSKKSSTFAARNFIMYTANKITLETLVCTRVKQLLIERKISVRKFAKGIDKDPSQLNKILNQQAVLPAYLIDDFARFLNVDRNTLVVEKNITFQTCDSNSTIDIHMEIAPYDSYKKITKVLEIIKK